MKKAITVQEAGRRGGKNTAATHNREFYKEIGRRGGQKTAANHGSIFYQELGVKASKIRWDKKSKSSEVV